MRAGSNYIDVNFGGTMVLRGDISELVTVDPNDLTEELVNYPRNVSWATSLAACGFLAKEEAEDKEKRSRVAAANNLRENPHPVGSDEAKSWKKLPEEALKTVIELDNAVIECTDRANVARKIYKDLEGYLDAVKATEKVIHKLIDLTLIEGNPVPLKFRNNTGDAVQEALDHRREASSRKRPKTGA